MRCIRWVVFVAVGSLAGGCLSMIIPEHHPATELDMGAGLGGDASGTGGNAATPLDAGSDLGDVDGGAP
ncbi:MAG TPA: hypothetical protein VGL86_17295 [Polyangia bacterium]